ncbi:lantibiotic dehydratase [Actinopolyspora halophila]|uniref:lantibiotic dehydratase n=1 Tax=Actinopolyspora TaxID=1849 RepID=UPI00036E98A7|nr:lantibiotic dehydratase [Actinopolyspora halophila]
MPTRDYAHHGTGVLRASARTVEPAWWPDPDDEHDCRQWLAEVWGLPGLAAAIRHASPILADRVHSILGNDSVRAKDARRAALSVTRYVLRFRRSTPFGLFTGVAPARVAPESQSRWGQHHRPVISPDTGWLHQLIRQLEDCRELLALLDVRFTELAEARHGRLVIPGQNTVSVRDTAAVRTVREEARSPVQVQVLADKLTQVFPQAGDPLGMLGELVRNGFLITGLRAPSTVTDPLGHVLDRLRPLPTEALPVAGLVRELHHLEAAVREHNDTPSEPARIELAERMRQLHHTAREPLTVDLRLNARVSIPRSVARDMERAATVLARLARETTGTPAWREYVAAFIERYGTGTLVPLRELLNPESGLGFPRGYPGSTPDSGRHVLSERDTLLLRLASRATARGDREIELDEDTVAALEQAGGGAAPRPPHLDLAARVHAASREELDRGDYTLTVAPGRVAGTFTARFAPLVPEAGLDRVFATCPTIADGPVAAHLSFPPIFANAENVSRTPHHRPETVSVGEHNTAGITIDDLAVTATNHRMHLVSLSRGQVVEPEVPHALAWKQQPPVARFLGELARAHGLGWIGIDWGAAATLPFRPRLRYGRTILCPAMWRLTRSDLADEWSQALEQWRLTWKCPDRVELRDFDQRLPLDLDVPAHRAILFRHVRQHDEAVLLETPSPDEDGWIDGHAHNVVLPLTCRHAPDPAPPIASAPLLSRAHGHAPFSPDARWLYAKLYVPAEHTDHLLVAELPTLLDVLDGRDHWFVRFPRIKDADEPDHLRLRIRVDEDAEQVATALGQWVHRLRTDGTLARLALTTYFPEAGRYLTMPDAEAVFVADSRFVLDALTHLNADRTVITALSLFDVAAAFLGDRTAADDWLHHTAPSAPPDRTLLTRVTQLVRGNGLADLPGWPAVSGAHHARADALATYRTALPDGAALGGVLHPLLHMHHNRLVGADRPNEAVCLRLARQAAATWRACRRDEP